MSQLKHNPAATFGRLNNVLGPLILIQSSVLSLKNYFIVENFKVLTSRENSIMNLKCLSLSVSIYSSRTILFYPSSTYFPKIILRHIPDILSLHSQVIQYRQYFLTYSCCKISNVCVLIFLFSSTSQLFSESDKIPNQNNSILYHHTVQIGMTNSWSLNPAGSLALVNNYADNIRKQLPLPIKMLQKLPKPPKF